MTVGIPQVVGRDDELASLLDLVQAPDGQAPLAVIAGEAGIGKTALWLAAVEEARARGFLVLSSRPAEAEAGFSFAGLADLLAEVADEVLPALPSPQRRALEVALAVAEADEPVEEALVAFALVTTLRRLSDATPILLAVDDVQWLDPASLAVLRFALARLRSRPLVALLTCRGHVPSWVLRASPEATIVDLQGLSIGALHELLRARLGTQLPRPSVVRVWETSGGNPFVALELARALERRGGRLDPGEGLPIPKTLDDLLQERLDALTAPAEEVARAVAALAEATTALVEAAIGRAALTGLAEAFEAQLLEQTGERVRFTHPLLASAILARMSPSERRELHARLAAVVPREEERARHLALAAWQPDEAIAAALEAAARHTRARGAIAGAAELAEQAVRSTPPDDDAEVRRRSVEAADHLFEAGDVGRAIALLEGALATVEPGPARAAILHRIGTLRTHVDGPNDAIAVFEEALRQTAGAHAIEAALRLELADALRYATGVRRAEPHAEAALRAAKRAGDDVLVCKALAVHGLIRFRLGHGIDEEAMAHALALERSLGLPSAIWSPRLALLDQLFWSHDLDAARTVAEDFIEEMERRLGEGATYVAGTPTGIRIAEQALVQPEPTWYLALIEWRNGDWPRAAELAESARAADAVSGRGGLAPLVEWPGTLIAAHRGLVGQSRAWAAAALARAEEAGIGIAEAGHRWVLGFVDLSLGDAEGALVHLRRAHDLREALGYEEPGQGCELPDLLDALVAVGDLDEAERLGMQWERRARALDRAWALAASARTRALVHAARGDVDGAAAAFDEALVHHARIDDPFQHGRTLLAQGAARRRAKQRAAARETLERALGLFDRLGAPLWAERTRAELARIGGRAPSRGELTEAERRIAVLVADGRTNREVAAALFLTEQTVATALTRVYRKLGVRSRTELARRIAAQSHDSKRAKT